MANAINNAYSINITLFLYLWPPPFMFCERLGQKVIGLQAKLSALFFLIYTIILSLA
jgi:hypothetical protein